MSTTISVTAIINSWNSNINPATIPFQNCVEVLNLYIKFRSDDWIKSRNNLKLAKTLATQIGEIKYNPKDPDSLLAALDKAIDYITDKKSKIDNPSGASCLAAMSTFFIAHLESYKLQQNFFKNTVSK